MSERPDIYIHTYTIGDTYIHTYIYNQRYIHTYTTKDRYIHTYTNNQRFIHTYFVEQIPAYTNSNMHTGIDIVYKYLYKIHTYIELLNKPNMLKKKRHFTLN